MSLYALRLLAVVRFKLQTITISGIQVGECFSYDFLFFYWNDGDNLYEHV